MDAGVWVTLAAVIVVVGFGLYRRATDGRGRSVPTGTSLDAVRLGSPLGAGATFVQFSSSVCAPCRATHRLLTEVVAADDALVHVDVDAEGRLDLVAEFDVTRTPTVLLLDGAGRLRHRFTGAPRRDDVEQALRQFRRQRATMTS